MTNKLLFGKQKTEKTKKKNDISVYYREQYVSAKQSLLPVWSVTSFKNARHTTQLL